MGLEAEAETTFRFRNIHRYIVLLLIGLEPKEGPTNILEFCHKNKKTNNVQKHVRQPES